MNNTSNSPPQPQRGSMTDKAFENFSQFIYTNVGIKLPPSKKTMIEARLQKRLRHYNFADHATYLEFLFSPKGQKEELTNLIDVVTTNTTDFFREPQHFTHLTNVLLPEWIASHGRTRRSLRIWSAGCSLGMEPYTLAMVLSEYQQRHSGFNFTILATDISTQALQQASNAVYEEDRVTGVPPQLKAKYFLRSKNRTQRKLRIVPELRRKVEFRRLNFMEDFSFKQQMDIIFCRNVVIYFDKPTQHRLFTKFCRCITNGGHLFIGHSESLSGMELPLRQVIPTVYVHV